MHYIVFVTTPSLEVARKLTSGILKNRFAACANLVSGLESHYWWDGKLCCEEEVLLILKTTTECLKELETFVMEEHPYDTPEFISLPIASGSQKYLDWLVANTVHSG